MRHAAERERITRRALLVRGVVGMGALALAPPVGGVRARLGTVLGPGRVGEHAERRFVLSVLDLDRPGREARRIALDFFGHGIAADPLDANRIVLFEKRGPGACEIDLAAGEVLRPIQTTDREFYGHGAFSPDGSLLYATESVPADDYRGVIVVRDGRTLEELGEFPSFGVSPHDCVLRDEGETLVVTNGGSRIQGRGDPPCVTYVDVPSRKLLERVEFANPDLGAGHLALTQRGDLAVVSAAREWMASDGSGGASLRPLGGELHTVEEPRAITARMCGETLSVAIHETSGVVGVTNPLGNLVTFWDLGTGLLRRSLDLAAPRGIAVGLDGSRFIVSYGRGTSLLDVSSDTLEPIMGSRRSELDMQGSHIVVHATG